MSGRIRWRLMFIATGSAVAFCWWWFDPFNEMTAALDSRVRAFADAGALQSAVKSYHAEYGRFPLPSSTTSANADQGVESKDAMVDCLLGANVNELNPREVVFLNPRRYAMKAGDLIKKGDSFNDPWARPYRIVMDTNGTLTVDNPQFNHPGMPVKSGLPREVPTRVLVYSLGADGLDGTADDIDSWRDLIHPRAQWHLETELLAIQAVLLALIASGFVCLLLLAKDALKQRRQPT